MAAWLLLLMLPAGAWAQIDARALQRAQQRGEDTGNLFGSNPYEQSN